MLRADAKAADYQAQQAAGAASAVNYRKRGISWVVDVAKRRVMRSGPNGVDEDGLKSLQGCGGTLHAIQAS